MNVRDELRAPRLEPERRDRLVALCEEIVERVIGGRDAAELIYAFNREVGRAFGPTAFRGVFGSEECDAFVERILTPVPDPLPAISDDDAEAMVRAILEGEVDDRESWFFVEMLSEHFDQPKFSDLIYWPSRELSAGETVQAAKLSGEELDTYLDEMAHGPPPPTRGKRQPEVRLRTARRVLQELGRMKLVKVIDDTAAVDLVADALAAEGSLAQRASAVGTALLDPFATSELRATDQQIAKVLRLTRTN